jgi:hypothetical protein
MKFISILLVASVLFIIGCTEQSQKEDKITTQNEEPQYLLVQNSDNVELTSTTLTLLGINEETIFFSDRPERIAGKVYTSDVVENWGMGKNNFEEDPPNATLSIFGEEEIADLIIELRNPKLEEDKLTYDIAVLEGEIPDFNGEATLFIDLVGMPLTPVSVAGVARRTTRRVVYHY